MVKPRPAHKTIKFINQYCEIYRDLFRSEDILSILSIFIWD